MLFAIIAESRQLAVLLCVSGIYIYKKGYKPNTFCRIFDMKNMKEETSPVYKVAEKVRATALALETTPC